MDDGVEVGSVIPLLNIYNSSKGKIIRLEVNDGLGEKMKLEKGFEKDIDISNVLRLKKA